MKVKNLLIGDIRFQFKYGFYFLYFVFSFIYIVMIKILPEVIINKIALILILSDPATIGLIFMGAIIHLEVTERTINSLYIAPITPRQYLIAKLLSISIISSIVGVIIGIAAGIIGNVLMFTLGLFIGSLLFSTIGLILAFKTNTLNQFFMTIFPAMILIIVPGSSYILGFNPPWLILHPAVSIIEIMSTGQYLFLSLFISVLWLFSFFVYANRIVYKRFRGEGGVKHERNL